MHRELKNAASLKPGGWTLQPYVDDLKLADQSVSEWDVAAPLRLMRSTWNEVFGRTLGRAECSLAFETLDHLNNWTHQRNNSGDDAYRAFETSGCPPPSAAAPQSRDVDGIRDPAGAQGRSSQRRFTMREDVTFAQRVAQEAGVVLTHEDLWYMSTQAGAYALGQEDRLGAIVPAWRPSVVWSGVSPGARRVACKFLSMERLGRYCHLRLFQECER